VLDTDAVMLPRIVPLGDVDEEVLAFAQAASPDTLAELETPPSIDGLQRRLLLAQLIAAWAKGIKPQDPARTPLVIGGPASILALADDLARLMDDMVTRGVDWKALDGLVPDALDEYWQLTLQFLNIAKDVWPGILAAHGRIEPAARPLDRGRGQEAGRSYGRPCDRGRFDGLDAVDREVSPGNRKPATRRGGVAGA
jgi:ATP-dependent helicase/nuclease subunit B